MQSPWTVYRAISIKICISCNKEKSLDSFHKHKGMKDGLLNKCKVCVLNNVYKWRKENPDCRKKEHSKVRERKGFLTRSEYYSKLKENAIGKRVSATKYAHKRRIQTSKFKDELTEFCLEEAISLTKILENKTGIKWHVDHIIPLNGKTVCGLHVYNNFQVLPALVNLRKSNKMVSGY